MRTYNAAPQGRDSNTLAKYKKKCWLMEADGRGDGIPHKLLLSSLRPFSTLFISKAPEKENVNLKKERTFPTNEET